MTWAQRLKRVFNIDIEVCGRCGGAVRVIAALKTRRHYRILDHLRQKEQNYLPSRSWCHPPEPRRARCLFSRGRARGSRTRFFIDQAAGTPTDWYRFLWATAWKRPQKICKWAHASEISAHPVAIERSIPAEQRDSGKKFSTICRLLFLYFSCTIVTTAAAKAFEPWHHRMPVLLAGEEIERWLDNRTPIAADDPVCAPRLKFAWKVAPLPSAVGNARNKSPALMEPVGETVELAAEP